MNRRIPPHSLDAERAVLGCVMLRPEFLADAIEAGLDASAFYASKHGATFATIVALATRGDAVDALTVAEELGGGSYGTGPDLEELVKLTVDTIPSTAHLAAYAERVVGYARVRRILGAAAEITEAGYDPASKADPGAFGDWAESMLHAAAAREDAGSTPAELGQVLDDAIAELLARSSGERIGVPSGFVDLDRMTGGLRPGQLVVLGARPSIGKSALALDIGLYVARTGGPVLFVSAEMSALELGTRVLAGGGVASDRLLSARLGGGDFSRLESRRAELAGIPLLIDDSPGATLLAIRARARRQASRGGLALLVVDYLQLVGAERRGTRRESEVAEVSRGLKALARELHVPVLAVAQLNRAVELREDKRPILADLRESGQLEQDADVVLLLHRPAVYDLDADAGLAELLVAKHRNGPTGVVHLTWLPPRMSFVNAATGFGRAG